jgi:hypothetical protein
MLKAMGIIGMKACTRLPTAEDAATWHKNWQFFKFKNEIPWCPWVLLRSKHSSKYTMNLVGGFSEWILDTQQSLGSFCDSTTQADLPTSLHSILGRKCKQARSVMSLNPKPKSNRPKWITDWGLLKKGPTALKQKLDVKAAPCSLDHHHPPSLL